MYLVHSLTTGTPKCDTFFVETAHKIIKMDKNVKISLYWRIVIKEDSYLSGTIKSNGN